MVSLVTALVAATGTPMRTLLEEFGTACFGKWVHYVLDHFENKTIFDVMADIDNFHETEVRKLYPNAELPSFQVEQRDEDHLVLGYHSCRPLADLAVGVIKGAGAHLKERVQVRQEPAVGIEGAYVRINITRLP